MRRGALFYHTLNGARVGDLFMSLIHAAALNHAALLEYRAAPAPCRRGRRPPRYLGALELSAARTPQQAGPACLISGSARQSSLAQCGRKDTYLGRRRPSHKENAVAIAEASSRFLKLLAF